MRITEIRSREDALAIVDLAEAHRNECAPSIPFDPVVTLTSALSIVDDLERSDLNCWVVRDDENNPIGYSVGQLKQYFFNKEKMAQLEILYILPGKRGGWGAVKLVKCFDAWARQNGAIQQFVGVARTDKDEAVHIRKLFPKLKYNWCGSYYIKETTS